MSKETGKDKEQDSTKTEDLRTSRESAETCNSRLLPTEGSGFGWETVYCLSVAQKLSHKDQFCPRTEDGSISYITYDEINHINSSIIPHLHYPNKRFHYWSSSNQDMPYFLLHQIRPPPSPNPESHYSSSSSSSSGNFDQSTHSSFFSSGKKYSERILEYPLIAPIHHI